MESGGKNVVDGVDLDALSDAQIKERLVEQDAELAKKWEEKELTRVELEKLYKRTFSKGKLKYLRSIEAAVQEEWNAAKVYEGNPREGSEGTVDDKFYATFAYPYMNGRLHLGHVFAFSKAEFSTRFQRMLGKNTLLPLGFHCTGMPIQASADKLRREIATFGNPPKFPAEEADGAKKKSKVAAKEGNTRYTWKILANLGVAEEEIPKFVDSSYWLRYFPPYCRSDIQSIGAAVDWRRSFITTSANPYYDSFIRWQFNTLKEMGHVKFGKRQTIWSPVDNQPCADHDRAKGEGVKPVEYTLIKLELLSLPKDIVDQVASHEERKFYMVAGTFRPETMYGQTNCWVKPDGEYGLFAIDDKQVFICSDQSALNMAYQGMSPEFGKSKCIGRINGSQLIGVPLKAPLCQFYDHIYALPMESIKMEKATGIVTSVPSDAPADWQTLQDLKNDADLRRKFGVKDEWVLPFEVQAIIKVPELGELAAKKACQDFGVKNREDEKALSDAKNHVYKMGFNKGVMMVGPYKGRLVSEVKPIIKQELIEAGLAANYAEPQEPVVSRSDNLCVVCLTDQWYLEYGTPEWREQVEQHVDNTLNTYFDDCLHALHRAIEWLEQWDISRTWGLGTRIPWDETFLIESLSDSTIYMAYYTVAHYLQSDLYGEKPGSLGIKAEDMTHSAWDYVFRGKEYAEDCPVPREKLDTMRKEFKYWYPMDLRSSGKDLVGNHLTMTLYQHAAFFPKEQWPLGIRVTGHMQLNGDKMSKSSGNYLSLEQGVRKFGCDATRLTLGKAGDGMADGNFQEMEARANILTLYSIVHWAEGVVKGEEGELRQGEMLFYDTLMQNEINVAYTQTKEEFAATFFRNGLEKGYVALTNSWKTYMSNVGEVGLDVGPHKELVYNYLRALAIVLCPVCPHIAEHLWRKVLGNETFVVNERWPEGAERNVMADNMYRYFENAVKDARKRLTLYQKKNEPAKLVTVWLAGKVTGWQSKAATMIADMLAKDPDMGMGDLVKAVNSDPEIAALPKKTKKVIPGMVKKAMSGKGAVGTSFDELELLTRFRDLFSKKLGIEVAIKTIGVDGKPKGGKAQPGKPAFSFE